MKKIEMKKLDDLWRDKVKELAGYKCENCGHKKGIVQLNSHHIFGRKNRSTRWDLSNGICLCAWHHKLSPIFSAHETPTIFKDWLIEYRGKEWHEKLNKKHNETAKDQDFNTIKESLL